MKRHALFSLMLLLACSDDNATTTTGQCVAPRVSVQGRCMAPDTTPATNNTNNTGGTTPTDEPWADTDGDGILDRFDNCPQAINPDQADADGDGVGDVCDSCPANANADQADADGDGVGDVCAMSVVPYDPDRDGDGDGVPDRLDNCPNSANVDQADADGDGVGDVCDNCPNLANLDQRDENSDGLGDACELEAVGPICANQTSEFVPVKPAIYLVVDRSTSMNGRDGTPQTRMDRAKAGMDGIADAMASDILIGIAAYPYRDNPNVAQQCGMKSRELLALGEEKPPQALPRIANPPPPEVKPDVVDPTPDDSPSLQKPEVKPEPPPETPEEVRRKKMQDALSALHDPNRPVNDDTPAGSEEGVVGGTVSDAALAHLMNTYTARLIQALRERREAPSSLSEEEIAALDRKVAIYVRLSSEGHILSYQWVKRSGNDLYDDSLELTLKRFMLQYGGRTLPLPEQPEVREQVLLQGLRFTGM